MVALEAARGPIQGGLEARWEANFPNIPNIPGARKRGMFGMFGPHPLPATHFAGTRPSALGEGNKPSIPAV